MTSFYTWTFRVMLLFLLLLAGVLARTQPPGMGRSPGTPTLPGGSAGSEATLPGSPPATAVRPVPGNNQIDPLAAFGPWLMVRNTGPRLLNAGATLP